MTSTTAPLAEHIPFHAPPTPFPVVALVASAGGLHALSAVVGGLPETFPGAVIAMQHLSPSTPSSLAAILGNRSPLTARTAADAHLLRPGEIVAIPHAAHGLVDPMGRVRLIASDHAPRPSADLLLATMATSLGERAIAVVLTGHGEDGANGAAAVCALGGTVLAEDPATAHASSMPYAAITRSARCKVLPLHEIAPALCTLTGATPLRAARAGEN